MPSTNARTARLGLEALESREVPATLRGSFPGLTDNAAVRTDQSVARSDNGMSVAVWMQSGTIYAKLFGDYGNARILPSVASSSWAIQVSNPSVDMAPNGRFVVAWTEWNASSNTTSIDVQRFDPYGTKVDIPEVISGHVFGQVVDHPDVAVNSRGDIAIAYDETDGPGNRDVYVDLIDWSSSDFVPGTTMVASTPMDEWDPSVAMNASGQFVVGYQSSGWLPAKRQNESFAFARSFTSSGGGSAVAYLGGGPGVWCDQPAVGIDDNGNFVGAFTYHTPSTMGVAAQRFDFNGKVLNTYANVNAGDSYPSSAPSVDMTSDGRFVIAYQRYYRDAFTGAKDIDILAVQYDNTGHPIGTIPITVASAGAGGGNPSVAVDSSGAFTVDYQNGTSAASGRLDARTYGW